MHPSQLPSEKWQDQAVAFLARCRVQMWGKHREEPLAWLFRAGFTVSLAQEMLFGWNFRPMTRKAANWLGPSREGEGLLLPRGLVLPWIRDQKILRLTILGEDGESSVLEGSSTAMMEAGEGKKLVLAFSDGDFFRLLQDLPEDFSIMSAPFPDEISAWNPEPFERIFFVSERTKEREGLLEQLLKKDLSVRAIWLPCREIASGILEKRLTERDLFPIIQSAD